MGSSPLTRGKRPVRRDGRTPPGLIPAHAGKTGQGARPPGPRRAHPRSRGENLARTHWGESSPGSSPLTRGKRGRWIVETQTGGLIPAHAGKTAHCPDSGPARWAHPRSRGENLYVSAVPPDTAGSSPLTRGKRRMGHANRRLAGLIPAHAGKTRRGRASCEAWWAHPRSRGENSTPFAASWAVMGSSPLTRGKPSQAGSTAGIKGLIPAHAGKTPSGAVICAASWAHPRSRGENCCTGAGSALNAGSSPLTRGKL